MSLLDFGMGLHMAPSEYFVGDRLRWYLGEMRAMGMTVLTTQNKDPYTYQLAREYGFEVPLFRPMMYLTELYQDLSGVEAMKQHGYKAMVQPYNEPSDDREWPGGRPWNYVEIWIDRWIDAAQKIHHAGGYPGIQCLDPEEELRPLLQEIKQRGLDFLFERMWMSVHNYPNNHPPTFPYDAVNAGQYTVYDPDGYLSFLVPLAFDKVFREEISRSVDTYCTEGGWTVGDDADNRYPKVTVELHRDYTLEVVRAFKAGKLPTGEPWAKWWKGFTFWLAASTAMQGPMDFEANAWFYSAIREPYTTLTPTIDALKELSEGEPIRPTFEDGPVEPTPPEPEPPEPEPPTPPQMWAVFDRTGKRTNVFAVVDNALREVVRVDGYIQPFGAEPLQLLTETAQVEVKQLRRELADMQRALTSAEGKIERAKRELG